MRPSKQTNTQHLCSSQEMILSADPGLHMYACACTRAHPHLLLKSNKHPEHFNRPKDHPGLLSSLPRALGSTVKQCCVLGDIIFVDTHGDTIVTASHFSQTNLCPVPLCLLRECWCSGLANFRSFSATLSSLKARSAASLAATAY